MTSFLGAEVSDESMVEVREQYLTPLYWDRDTTVSTFTIRGAQVVYILGFEGGVVKVGQSIDFDTRRSSHVYNRRVAGHRLACLWRVWSDAPHRDEQTLMRLAASLGGEQMGRTTEWFTGVDVHTLIAAAELELVRDPIPTQPQ